MPIEVRCSCGKRLVAPDAAAGRRAKCPACSNILIVPQPAPVRAAQAAESPNAPSPALRPPADDADDDYRIAPDPEPAPPPPLPPKLSPRRDPAGPEKVCPSCGKRFPADAKVCVQCGIDLRTGRSLITSRGIDESELREKVDGVLAVLGWFVPLGLYPLTSDAFGKFRPMAIRAIAAAIVLISVLYWIVGLTNGRAASEPLGPWPDLLLWAGSRTNPRLFGYEGEFHWYQLLTNTFLHANLLHLGGNLVFLLVFGQRINAVFGQWKTAVIYLFLAVAASVVFLISRSGEPMIPALGASGAIMGLAGMYFVLMPASRVHMVAWLQLGFATGFRCLKKYFVVRGFAVLLFYIAFDVAATLFNWRDGTAHWAHLGGFISGAILALVLLLTRQVNMHGADIISVLLGRHSWRLLGTPAENS